MAGKILGVVANERTLRAVVVESANDKYGIHTNQGSHQQRSATYNSIDRYVGVRFITPE